MVDRNKSAYRTFLYEFINDVLVVCPKCSNQAIVRSNGFSFRDGNNDVKVTCSSCGFNKRIDRNPTVVLNPAGTRGKKISEGKHMIIGVPIDPFFHLSVWIKHDVGDNVLWAYNYRHLEFIRDFIDSKLRERNGGNLNRSLGSRLPRWMTSSANRDAILKAINKLKIPASKR